MSDESRGDSELLLATTRGDADAFATIVRRYIRNATLLATQILGDQDEAEDVAQVAFTIVYQRANEFDQQRPFAPWFYAIVRRLALKNRARALRRERLLRLWHRITDRGAATTASDEDAVAARLDIETVTQKLAELSPMQRACFELVALRGIAIEDVAEMHDISESTVRQHVFRARRSLSRTLQEGMSGSNAWVTGTEAP